MQTVIDEGVFTRRNRTIINANFAELTNPDIWVRPQATVSEAADGSYARPFASMAAATPYLVPGIVVGLLGVLREEYVAPLGVNDVTIRGMATQPRQATTGGVANGGGATWMSPATVSNTAALCKVRAQGWRFENIYFNNSATGAPCVMLFMDGGGDPPVDSSAEHCSFYNCFFTGTDDGISSSGGPNFCTIQKCRFFGFSGTGDIAISSTVGAGVHSLYGWVIEDCEFWGNTRHIQAGLNGAVIRRNHFSYINNGVTTAIFYDATGGLNNAVFNNQFDVDSGNGGIAAMFVLGTNDRFAANQLSTAVTTTQFSWGDPA